MRNSDVDKMFTYLRGFLCGANMQESMKALTFARQCHDGNSEKMEKLHISFILFQWHVMQ